MIKNKTIIIFVIVILVFFIAVMGGSKLYLNNFSENKKEPEVSITENSDDLQTLEESVSYEEPVNENIEDTNSSDDELIVESTSEETEDVIYFEIDDTVRDNEYKNFVDDYVPDYKATTIPEDMLSELNKEYSDINFSEVTISFGNFIWWLENDFQNKVPELYYKAEIDKETHEIVLYYEESQKELFEENKDTLVNWLSSVSKASFYHTKYNTIIRIVTY